MIRSREANPKRFLLLVILAPLGIALAYAVLSYVLQETGSDPLPDWPKRVASFAAFIWAWKITGMYTALRMRERLGLRWLL